MTQDPEPIQLETEALCATARWCYAQGWVPATSGNFSVRARSAARIVISPSGMDKGQLTPGDLLEASLDGKAIDTQKKPSAETVLHAVIYRDRPASEAILHVHSVWNTLLSRGFGAQGYVELEGYELLKALNGVTTHEYRERLPVLENSQKYDELAADLAVALRKFPDTHGVLLRSHGLYTWGKSVAEARRHLEALEFLFEVEGRRLLGGMR